MLRSCFILLFGLVVFCNSTAQELRPAAFAKVSVEAPVSIQNPTAINSKAIDFSPAYLAQGIVFPTGRNSKGTRDKKINSTFFELFYADLDPNDNPLKPSPFSTEINSMLHEGPVSFTNDGQRIFFTRNTSEKGIRRADKNGLTRLQIFTATKGKYDWENIKALPFNANHFSCVHPSWDEEQGRLYFASNMLDGQGGYDLYYAEFADSTWGDPVNLGETINTAGNEQFPFYHPSGQLFFTSNGYHGLGGLDMYMTNLAGPDHRIINLGEPFNSEADDLGIILNPTGTKGFFASNREGGLGRDDIYQFGAPQGIDGRTLPPAVSLPVFVINATNKAAIPGASIRIFEKRGDQFFQKDKSLFEAVLLPQSEGSTQLVFKTLRNDLSNLGSPNASTDVAGNAQINLLGFREYKFLLDAPGYETLEYSYLTDANQAPKTAEIEMSPRNCLQVKGGAYSALTKGPIPSTLIKIRSLSTGQENIMLSNALGRFDACLDYGDVYELTAYKEKFEAQTIRVKPTDFANQRNRAVDFTLKPDRGLYGEGTVIILENIYYDFDKYQIRAGAALELEELAQLMRIYPSMEVRLEAHTDSRGDNRYNKRLSEQRALAAKQYLAARQIQPYRIQTQGKGESMLRNQCSNGKPCSELDHQYNRRTVVIITKMADPVPVRYQLNTPETVGGK